MREEQIQKDLSYSNNDNTINENFNNQQEGQIQL
jgi:hypothetical protein